MELGAAMAIFDAQSRGHDDGVTDFCEETLRVLDHDDDDDPHVSAVRTWLRRRRPHDGVAGVCANDGCGAVGTHFCSLCLRTLYCSKAYQVADWIPTGQHRAECRAIRHAADKRAKAVAETQLL